MFNQHNESTKMDCQAFFFDFDGVLVDSVEVKTEAFAILFESFGPEVRDKVVDHHRRNGGMTRKDKFRHYYKEFLKKELDDAEMGRLCHIFSALVVKKVIAAPEIPGAEAFLAKWHNKVDCFVISATPDNEIEVILKRRGLNKYFREIRGSSHTKNQNLEDLLNKYGLKSEKCLFFGDAGSDYQAALMNRVPFIGILPGPEAPLLQIAPGIKWYRDFSSLNEDKLNEF